MSGCRFIEEVVNGAFKHPVSAHVFHITHCVFGENLLAWITYVSSVKTYYNAENVGGNQGKFFAMGEVKFCAPTSKFFKNARNKKE